MARQTMGEEANALWREVFGDAPPPGDDPGELLARVVENLPEVGYSRFTKPALSDSNIVWPENRKGSRP